MVAFFWVPGIDLPENLRANEDNYTVQQEPRELRSIVIEQPQWQNKRQGPRWIPHEERVRVRPPNGSLDLQQFSWRVGIATGEEELGGGPVFDKIVEHGV